MIVFGLASFLVALVAAFSAGNFYEKAIARNTNNGPCVILCMLAVVAVIFGSLFVWSDTRHNYIGMPAPANKFLLNEHDVYKLVRQEIVNGQNLALMIEPDGTTVRLFKLEQLLPAGTYFKVRKSDEEKFLFEPLP